MSLEILYNFGQSIVDSCHSFVDFLSSPVIPSDSVLLKMVCPFPSSFTWWEFFTFTGITLYLGLAAVKWIKNMIL